MLKKHMAWPASHLVFDDVKGGIAYIRANIADISHAEANKSFEWTIKIYDELYRTFGQDGKAA